MNAGPNPWLIAVVVAVATFMEVLDTTIANVALPYIAGGLGVSEDESSWVVTTYLVSNAVILTASSFIVRRLGRKSFFLACLALFTVSSVLCGFAWNLQALLMFRVLQGLAGGGMVPVSQSILADSFPPAKRGQAFALFGVAVVVVPVVGPTLGGWLSDNYSWHWCFMINGPVGLLAIALIALILRESQAATEARRQLLQQGIRFDLVGFVLGATFLGALEIVLDRGRLVRLQLHRHGRGRLRARIPADDPMGDESPQSDDRHPDGGDTPVRLLFPGDAGDRRHPLGNHTIPPPAGAAGLRLHCHLGRSCALAGRPGHHGNDVRHRPSDEQGPAQIPARRRGDNRRSVDVRPHQRLRRSRLLVLRTLAHAARRRPAVDLPVDHDRVLRRHPA
jgi:hypothetical protein